MHFLMSAVVSGESFWQLPKCVINAIIKHLDLQPHAIHQGLDVSPDCSSFPTISGSSRHATHTDATKAGKMLHSITAIPGTPYPRPRRRRAGLRDGHEGTLRWLCAQPFGEPRQRTAKRAALLCVVSEQRIGLDVHRAALFAVTQATLRIRDADVSEQRNLSRLKSQRVHVAGLRHNGHTHAVATGRRERQV